MSDLTDGEKTVLVISEALAWTWVWFAVTALMDRHWLVSVGLLGLGMVSSIFGFKYPSLKRNISPRFIFLAASTETALGDFRIKAAMVLIMAICVSTVATVYLHSLHEDIDTYLIPRTLTQSQSEELSKAVVGVSSDIKINVLYFSWDPEATEYAGQIFMAIRTSGWDIQMQPVNLWNPKDQPDNPFNHFVLSQGLGMEVCIPGQPTQEDEKHLKPFIILRSAMEKSGIEVNMGGEKADCGAYVLNLIVGRRPFRLGKGPTIMQRFARWFSRLAG